MGLQVRVAAEQVGEQELEIVEGAEAMAGSQAGTDLDSLVEIAGFLLVALAVELQSVVGVVVVVVARWVGMELVGLGPQEVDSQSLVAAVGEAGSQTLAVEVVQEVD